jgi:hypothetical protein
MPQMTATELAARLELSKARISQYVSEGKLAGCYAGDGRARRFDLDKVAQVLGRRLHLGQQTGNGLATRRILRDLVGDEPVATPPSRHRDGELAPTDPDRLELATIQIKEEEARRRRRENARDEGLWVLAEEVERQTARALATEVGQFEAVIRDGARAVADALGVDYRQVRKLLVDQWRAHRARRAAQLGQQANEAAMTPAETAEQV